MRLNATAVIFLLSALGSASVAIAQEESSSPKRFEASVLAGLQALNKNDTALPDQITNVPAVGTISYSFTRNWVAEGELAWVIPVEQDIDRGPGLTQKLKTPNILAYQAGVRADWPVNATWTPYLAAGAGAVTFLSNTDANRFPALKDSQTAFALNFGAGTFYHFAGPVGLRADYRELVAFPSDSATGLSTAGSADPIWMERGSLGVSFRF